MRASDKVWGRMRIGVADKSWQRFRAHVKELLHMGRGRNMGRFIRETLNPVLQPARAVVVCGSTRPDTIPAAAIFPADGIVFAAGKRLTW